MDNKIVDYATYCKKCEHYEKPEYEHPCNDCLNIPARPDSHKPEWFKEKDDAR